MRTQPSSSSGWPERLAATIGERVKHFRTAHEPPLSAQRLADMTVELGHPLTRSTISGMESGRRGTATVADLLVLALALGVPPVKLVVPIGKDEKAEFAPGRRADAFEVVDWFGGGGPSPDLDYTGEWSSTRPDPIRLIRAHRAISNRWFEAVQDAGLTRDDERRATFLGNAEREREQLLEVRRRLREGGYRLPWIPVDQARALGELDSDAT